MGLQPALVFQSRLIWDMPVKHILEKQWRETGLSLLCYGPYNFVVSYIWASCVETLGLDMKSFIFHPAWAGLCQHTTCKTGKSWGSQFQHTHLFKDVINVKTLTARNKAVSTDWHLSLFCSVTTWILFCLSGSPHSVWLFFFNQFWVYQNSIFNSGIGASFLFLEDFFSWSVHVFQKCG